MDTEQAFNSITPRYHEFNGQVALVTGSSRGIGKGIALRLAREAMKVVIHGRDRDEVDDTVNTFQALGADVIGIANDLSDDGAIHMMFDEIHQRFGRFDLLVNNAADLRRRKFTNEHNELLDYQLTVNLRAPYLCSWHAAQIMREEKRGNIVHISSVGGLRAHWVGLPYDVTKGGIDAMTRAMALELAADGIRVNAVAPGAIRTEKTPQSDGEKYTAISERIPLARYGTTLEIGSAVAFLASSEATYITGQILYVDGGITTQLSPPGQPI